MEEFKKKRLKGSTVLDWQHYYNREVRRLRKVAKVSKSRENCNCRSLANHLKSEVYILFWKARHTLTAIDWQYEPMGDNNRSECCYWDGDKNGDEHTGKKQAINLRKEWTMCVLLWTGYTKIKANVMFCLIIWGDSKKLFGWHTLATCICGNGRCASKFDHYWYHTATKFVVNRQLKKGKWNCLVLVMTTLQWALFNIFKGQCIQLRC